MSKKNDPKTIAVKIYLEQMQELKMKLIPLLGVNFCDGVVIETFKPEHIEITADEICMILECMDVCRDGCVEWIEEKEGNNGRDSV